MRSRRKSVFSISFLGKLSRQISFEKGLPEIRAQKQPFLSYAAKHWTAYLRRLDAGDETTQNLIRELHHAGKSKSEDCLSMFWHRNYQ